MTVSFPDSAFSQRLHHSWRLWVYFAHDSFPLFLLQDNEHRIADWHEAMETGVENTDMNIECSVNILYNKIFYTNLYPTTATNIIMSEWVKLLSCVRLFATPWTVALAYQAPPSMGFSRQEYWSGLPFPSPGESFWPRDQTWVSRIAGRHFNLWATREALISTPSFPGRLYSSCCSWSHSPTIWCPPTRQRSSGLPSFSGKPGRMRRGLEH